MEMKNKTPASHLRTWLYDLPIQDPVNRRMAALLQVMLLGFVALVIIASLLSLIIPPSNISAQSVIIRGAIFIILIAIPLILLRGGHFRSSVLILIGIFLLLEAVAVWSATLREVAETLSFFTLAIILAGLLVGRRVLVITYLLSVGAVSLAAYREQSAGLDSDGVIVALNFILLQGLMALFLGQFGITLRAALNAARERERELESEIIVRRNGEKRIAKTTHWPWR